MKKLYLALDALSVLILVLLVVYLFTGWTWVYQTGDGFSGGDLLRLATAVILHILAVVWLFSRFEDIEKR